MYYGLETPIVVASTSVRDIAISSMARHLHGDEHDEVTPKGFGKCDQKWHTESWFEHIAAEIYDGGTGGR